jgi:homocitrate synthase NifV
LRGSVTNLGAGNTPLEAVVVAFTKLCGRETGIVLPELANVAAPARPIENNKTIVGDRVFPHELGIRVDGLLKDCRTYQALDPALLGHAHPQAHERISRQQRLR